MNWLQRLMLGRYGADRLSMALLIFALVLSLIAQWSGLTSLTLISYIPLGIVIYRILSRDISRRSMENYKFSMLVSPVYAWFKKTQKQVLDLKTHHHFVCPGCKTKLRLPKGKGKIMITCPKCNEKFIKKT